MYIHTYARVNRSGVMTKQYGIPDANFSQIPNTHPSGCGITNSLRELHGANDDISRRFLIVADDKNFLPHMIVFNPALWHSIMPYGTIIFQRNYAKLIPYAQRISDKTYTSSQSKILNFHRKRCVNIN